MAVIRQSINSRDTIKSSYIIEEQSVSFPMVMMIVCVIVDVLDIILYITVVGGVAWWVITMLIFTPILNAYITSQSKKYSGQGTEVTEDRRKNLEGVRDTSREAKAAKAASKAGAAAKKGAAAAKTTKFAKSLKWVTAIGENIPGVELAPINSIILYLAYRDNLKSVKNTKESRENLAKNQRFGINRPITRTRTGGRGAGLPTQNTSPRSTLK